ncbi:MAG: hypothetical protein CMN85_10655 [Spongiibacteraceae bacterium]|nr:hypothetical protein [Spongiibacteraceae bacterium]|tara:strand:+ start:23610 stop:24089 length:480 start_codon:yes stop_codon:yes gene_type:complete
MKVLVIGSGHNVKAELSQINRHTFDYVIGVNRAAIHFGPVDIHCSLHPRDYAPIRAGYFVSHIKLKGVDEVFPCMWRTGGSSGSSGLYAVKYALQRLDATDITLAGVGIDEAPHFYNPSDWHEAKKFQQTWIEVAPVLRGKVRSLGGWTAQLLNGGSPA